MGAVCGCQEKPENAGDSLGILTFYGSGALAATASVAPALLVAAPTLLHTPANRRITRRRPASCLQPRLY